MHSVPEANYFDVRYTDNDIFTIVSKLYRCTLLSLISYKLTEALPDHQ